MLIHQTRGANAGVWELNHIQGVSAGQLTLTAPLAHTYATDSGANRAQVLWVPQYSDLTVNAGISVSPAPWNGSTGGIVAFLVSSVANISGSITATGISVTLNANNLSDNYRNGIGFRGGYQENSTDQAQQGEGTGGDGSWGSAPNGNGGGGGLALSGYGIGGGGGGNGAAGGLAQGGQGTAGAGGAIMGTTDLTTMAFGGGGEVVRHMAKTEGDLEAMAGASFWRTHVPSN